MRLKPIAGELHLTIAREEHCGYTMWVAFVVEVSVSDHGVYTYFHTCESDCPHHDKTLQLGEHEVWVGQDLLEFEDEEGEEVEK